MWAAGDLLNNFDGDFIKFISARDLQRQEGVVFRHLLRLILLCDEFSQQTPAGLLKEAWRERLDGWATRLTASCRAVDAHSTDKMLDQARREQDDPTV